MEGYQLYFVGEGMEIGITCTETYVYIYSRAMNLIEIGRKLASLSFFVVSFYSIMHELFNLLFCFLTFRFSFNATVDVYEHFRKDSPLNT